MKYVVVALILGAALALHSPVSGADIEGVQFADQIQVGPAVLHLNCLGLLRYKYVFKGYVAGLYLPEHASPASALADGPKRLELSYFWNIDGADFGKAADAILARNLDPAALQALRPRIDQLHTRYESVKPGDRYALTYLPKVGTELALNDRRIVVIPGADFADAYFRIWLGKSPLDASLRDQLLGCAPLAGSHRG